MTVVRVFYNPVTKAIAGIEHRADEPRLGVAAYTDANRPEGHETEPWFTTDVTNRFDPQGDKIPVEFSEVDDSRPGDFRINTKPTWTAEKSKRNERSDGRRAALLTKLENDSITDAEVRELMRLERALN